MNLKKEVKSALINIWFITPLLILLILSIVDSLLEINNYNKFINSLPEYKDIETNICFPIYTSFTHWIGNSKSIYSNIFFWMSVILSSLPFSWSYCRTIEKNNYTEKSFARKSYIYKYISVFISSGLIVAIPLLINYLIVSLYIPSVMPDSVYNIYYGIFSNNFIGNLFYHFPYIYIFFYIILNFIFNGMLGVLGISVSTIVNSKTVAIIFPPLIMVIIEKTNDLWHSKFKYEISPISFLNPDTPNIDNGLIILTEILILIFISILLSICGLKGKSNEK